MEIFKLTNVLKSGVIKLDKGISSIIFGMNIPASALTTEAISIEIEKSNGTNIPITKGFVPLKDFVLLTTEEDDAVSYDEVEAKYTAVCDLTKDGGAIYLESGETIKIELNPMLAARTYWAHGTEEPVSSLNLHFFEQKSIEASSTNKTLEVSDFDSVVMDAHSSIQEVRMTYAFEDGSTQTIAQTLYELGAIARSVDAVREISSAGAVSSVIANKLTLPLLGVTHLEVRKTGGTIINLTFRS